MGGVDKADMLVALYKTPLRTLKWYMPIFVHLLDLAITNAWLLYLHENPGKRVPLIEFKLDISDALLVHKRQGKNTKSQASLIPCSEARRFEATHLPAKELKGKCRFCHKNQSRLACSQCNVRLCITNKRNCFYDYHTVVELPKRKRNTSNGEENKL